MSSDMIINYHFHKFTREDLMTLDPDVLGGVLRERIHHNIEVPLYPVLRAWPERVLRNFGNQAQFVFDVWHERGLPEDTPDIDWAKRYLAIAAKIPMIATTIISSTRVKPLFPTFLILFKNPSITNLLC